MHRPALIVGDVGGWKGTVEVMVLKKSEGKGCCSQHNEQRKRRRIDCGAWYYLARPRTHRIDMRRTTAFAQRRARSAHASYAWGAHWHQKHRPAERIHKRRDSSEGQVRLFEMITARDAAGWRSAGHRRNHAGKKGSQDEQDRSALQPRMRSMGHTPNY
jgi:hypothetical protein